MALTLPPLPFRRPVILITAANLWSVMICLTESRYHLFVATFFLGRSTSVSLETCCRFGTSSSNGGCVFEQKRLRWHGSKLVMKYPRCSLRGFSAYADAEVSPCQLAQHLRLLSFFPGGCIVWVLVTTAKQTHNNIENAVCVWGFGGMGNSLIDRRCWRCLECGLHCW